MDYRYAKNVVSITICIIIDVLFDFLQDPCQSERNFGEIA